MKPEQIHALGYCGNTQWLFIYLECTFVLYSIFTRSLPTKAAFQLQYKEEIFSFVSPDISTPCHFIHRH